MCLYLAEVGFRHWILLRDSSILVLINPPFMPVGFNCDYLNLIGVAFERAGECSVALSDLMWRCESIWT